MIPSGIIICQAKKANKKEMEKSTTNAYLIENKSQIPLRRRIATVRVVSVAFTLRMRRATIIVTAIHRSREFRIEKLRR
jgi:hypothetical protein